MKYMIHSCNKRLDYVKKYLIPSLVKQGINPDNIILWNDDNQLGCLKQWYLSCEYVRDNEDINDGIWHIQDDVIISRDFYEKTKEASDTIICGFRGNKKLFSNNFIGLTSIKNMWYSFQCIYIPNKYLSEFVDWFTQEIIIKGRKKTYYSRNKYDDAFFMWFIQEKHPEINCINLEDSLVDHIDYIIGGSIVNQELYVKNKARSISFKDKDLIKELENEIHNTHLS